MSDRARTEYRYEKLTWPEINDAVELGKVTFPHGCLRGECSLLSSFGPMSPHQARALFEAGRDQDLERLMRLQQETHLMCHNVLGPLLNEDRIDGAYDKILVRLGGMDEMPLRLLSPYQCFTEEEYQECKRVLHEEYPDWVTEEM